jgi:hypothetical protein
VLGALAGLLASRGVETGVVWSLAGVGAVGSLLLLVLPHVRLPAYRGWLRVALPFGRLLTGALLTVVYLLVVTPIGLLLRLVGRDPLERRIDRGAATYWRPHARRDDPEDPFRPY